MKQLGNISIGKKQEAVFYLNAYFLLPKEHDSYESFREAVHNSEKPLRVSAVVLRENHEIPSWSVQKGISIAPFFITGYHDEPSEIVITDENAMFPAEVTLLTQDEYNALLREKVLSYCPGCIRYRPISNRVQSLNGHFEELSLDGYCAFRAEKKPYPRRFREPLFFLGTPWRRPYFTEGKAEDVVRMIKEAVYTRISSWEYQEADGTRTLSLSSDYTLDFIIFELLSAYIQKVIDPHFLTVRAGFATIPELVRQCLSDPASFQKCCKRLGVGLLKLSTSKEYAGLVQDSLKDLIDRWYLFPLFTEEEGAWYLVSDVFSSLKALHFRAPLLSVAGTHAVLYSQFGMTEGNAWELENPAIKAVPLQPETDSALLSPKDLSTMFNQMIQTLNKRVFKPYGFQRSGQNFRLFRTVNGKEEGVIVNFQRSIFGDGNSTSFTVNLGIRDPFAHETSIPNNFKEYECSLERRTRIGIIAPEYQCDQWWTIDEQADMNQLTDEMERLLKTVAFPWLGMNNTEQKQ
jgi:hypothetical protein